MCVFHGLKDLLEQTESKKWLPIFWEITFYGIVLKVCIWEIFIWK